jgi:hypothetical protein
MAERHGENSGDGDAEINYENHERDERRSRNCPLIMRIPIQFGHLFRFNSAGHSGEFGHP